MFTSVSLSLLVLSLKLDTSLHTSSLVLIGVRGAVERPSDTVFTLV